MAASRCGSEPWGALPPDPEGRAPGGRLPDRYGGATCRRLRRPSDRPRAASTPGNNPLDGFRAMPPADASPFAVTTRVSPQAIFLSMRAVGSAGRCRDTERGSTRPSYPRRGTSPSAFLFPGDPGLAGYRGMRARRRYGLGCVQRVEGPAAAPGIAARVARGREFAFVERVEARAYAAALSDPARARDRIADPFQEYSRHGRRPRMVAQSTCDAPPALI